MSTHRYIDQICCGVLAVVLILTVVLVKAQETVIVPVLAQEAYVSGLFDTSRVHSIDIVMDDWEGFLDTCENKEYQICTVVIDGEAYKNVGIRAKGNTSLSSVEAYGNDRYSFKVEFDCYEGGRNYRGLDKISLNNIIQDYTYMKDYLSYQLMNTFDVASPLCSYAFLTVNGEDWGLYLAVEAVEESFLARNYGNDYGNLYKPDSMEMGGGRGNGGKPGVNGMPGPVQPETQETVGKGPSDFWQNLDQDEDRHALPERGKAAQATVNPENDTENPDNGPAVWNGESPEISMPQFPVMGGLRMGSDDVALIYSGDAYENYSNLFDNAKTDLTDADRDRLISSLKKLGEAQALEEVVDTDAVIRYFVVHNFVCNFDSYTGSLLHNYYLYEKDGKLSMIPWDYNLAFGGFGNGMDASEMVNFPIDSPVSGDTTDSRPMLAWIFSDEEYLEQYHRYFTKFVEQNFTGGYFEELVSSIKELIAPYVEKDPTKFCSYEEFDRGVEVLREFCLLRAESIRGQLAGTIPSTSEGQEQDKGALVDASGISLPQMGTMDTRGTWSSSVSRAEKSLK